MAVTLIAGIAAAASAAAAAGTGLFFATLFSMTGLTAFAIGAGLSLVSRALAPKLDLGTQMGGRSVMTREAAQSRKIVYGRARIGGNIVYLESTGADNKYLYLVIAVAGHEIDAYEEVWFNDEKIYNGTSFINGWAQFVNIAFYKGDQTTADSALVTASATNNGKWTADHKLLDTAYMVVRLEHDVDKFAQGLPNISTVIRGKKVLDPSNNTTAWSQNPALCIYDYLRDTKYGLGESVANILTSSVIAAKDVCNEPVSLAAGGTQPRYTIDGVVDTASSIKSNIETMTGSMIGRLIYSGGKFEIHAGEYVAPTITIDESMAVGEITVQTKQSRRSAFNGVKGVFVSEDDNYIVADYPAQISSTFAAQDGDPIYLDMPLPYTINNVRAQRIAKLALLRSRQQEAITIPCNLTALKFKIGDNISVNNTRLGYSGKVFEVVGYSMGFSADQMVVNVEAIETASSIWNWQKYDEEVFLGGGEVDLYDGKVAVAPASITVAGDSFLTADGAFNTSFIVSWPDTVDAFTDHYVVEHREYSSSTTAPYFSQQTKTSPFTIIGLQNSLQYNVRVKAVNELGVSSTYVNATPTAAVDATAPSLPTSITATAGYKSISLSWTNPSEKDFNNVEIWRSTSSSGTYAEVSNVAGGFGAKAEHLDGGLADATAFYYKFKSVDLTGNKTSDSDFNNQTPVNATTDAAAINGQNGLSSFLASAYQRQGYAYDYQLITGSVTATHDYESVAGSLEASFDYGALTGVVVPDTPSGGSFDFDNQSLTAPSGWSSIIPSGTNPLYISTAMASIQGITGIDSSLSWSTPELFAQSGTDGTDGTDGTNGDPGAAGVRNAAGYVYYSLTSTNAPNVPTATAYNFTTGAFTNLNASGGDNGTWSRTPPVNTGGDAKYWAASYYITEATYNGTQSFDFGTVFNSVTFDGLVTFTNLNTALATDGGNVTTIDGGLITTDSLTVNKLSGDVTEVYPIGIEVNNSMGTSGTTTYQDIWIPAPSLGLSKRQRISADFTFSIQNSSSTNYSAFFQYGLQYKGKTNIGASVGTVTHVSFPASYRQYVSLAGNVLDKIDNVGGVAKTNNGAGTYGVASIVGVSYDADDDKTYVLMANIGTTFATGDTLFFSVNRFESAGTFVANYTSLQTKMIFANTTERFSLPLQQYFGSSTTATNVRPYIVASTNMNNLTGTFKTVKGTMENIA